MRALVAAGFDVVAIAPEDPHSARLTELGCRFVPVRMSARGTSPLEDAKLLLDYRRILRKERPSAFLGYTIKPNVYGSLAAHSLKIPVINNIAGLGISFLKHGLFQRFVRMLYRAALRRSRTVFFQNPDDCSLFLEAGLVRERQTQLLPGSGVDLARFRPVEKTRKAEDPFVFLLVSRLLKSKGIAEFAAAAALVRARHPHAQFRIAGILEPGHRDSVSEEEMRRWEAAGAITYLGALDDVRPTLGEADAMVLPTFYPEGTPRSLLEAAAMGKPLITTDVPGCRDVLDEGVNGFLCEPKSIQSLADAMLRMIELSEEQLRSMGAASRRKAETRFDEQIVITRYLDAVRDALDSAS